MRKRRIVSVYFIYFIALTMVAQLVMTSGHIHLARSQDGIAKLWPVALAKGGGKTPYKSPSDYDPHCLLCWAHAIAGGLLLPEVAQLQGPISGAQKRNLLPSDQIEAFASAASFSPRAPPRLALYNIEPMFSA